MQLRGGRSRRGQERGDDAHVEDGGEAGDDEEAEVARDHRAGRGVLVVSEDGEEEAAAAAIVVGWAMARQGVKFADAPALVAKARTSATLNANFEKQLKVWETWKEFPGVPEWM